MTNSPLPNAQNSIEKDSSVENKNTVCPKCIGLYLLNQKTGEIFPARCKAYSCPHCGVKQEQRLYKFLLDYVKKWDWVRMFTFTFRENIFYNFDAQTQIKMCSEVWRRFLIYYSRSKALTKFNKQFRYVKSTEFQKNGSVHYHVLIDRYFPLGIAHDIFNLCINQVFLTTGTNGNIHLSDEVVQTTKNVVSYVVKYVVKSSIEMPKNLKYRKWSKNKKGSIFPIKINNPEFVFVNLRGNGIDLEGISTTSQQNFEIGSIFDVLDFDFIEKPPLVSTDEDFYEVFL